MPARTEMIQHPLVMDKNYVRELADEMNRLIGFTPDPNATALQAQQLVLEEGIDPNDNELSCEIICRCERSIPLEQK